MATPEQIKQQNEKIEEAIFISQMMDHPGYTVLTNFLKDKEKEIRYQDIFGLNDDNLETQKGIALMVDDMFTYFKKCKALAMVPKKDPETGEVEILNNKK